MKIELGMEPKDYLKILALAAALGVSFLKPDNSGERLAVLENEVKNVSVDVTEIKAILLRRQR